MIFVIWILLLLLLTPDLYSGLSSLTFSLCPQYWEWANWFIHDKIEHSQHLTFLHCHNSDVNVITCLTIKVVWSHVWIFDIFSLQNPMHGLLWKMKLILIIPWHTFNIKNANDITTKSSSLFTPGWFTCFSF